MLKAFVDDSGSGGDSPWFVLAGYIGACDGWDRFDAQWQTVLSGPPKLEYFKSSEAESLRPEGQWAGITPAERNDGINQLIGVIGKCSHRAIYIRTKQKDYDEVIKRYVPPEWDNAYYFLFMGIIMAFATAEKYGGSSTPIEFVFDNHQRFEKPSLRLYSQSLDIPQLTGRILNVHYEDEKDFLPLQAADLLAWQIRRRFCMKESPRAHFDMALECPAERPFDHALTRQDLEEVGERMDTDAQMKWAMMGLLEKDRPWKRPRRD